MKRPLTRARVILGGSAAILGVLVFAFVTAGRSWWAEREEARAATELAERYLTLMSSGKCEAAQRLTTFVGPPSYCAQAGVTLSQLQVHCEHREHRFEQHQVECQVDSASQHHERLVLIVSRDGRLLVVDARDNDPD